jgi:uncharacterized protein (TIGR00369 family)
MNDFVNPPDIGAFGKMLGFHIPEWDEGHVRMEMTLKPEHMNRSGVLHGGILAALLDTACGYAGTFCAKPGHVRWAVTVELNTNFTGQAKGGVVTVIGRKRTGGRNLFFASAEAFNEDGELIGFGDSVQRYRSGSGDPDGIPYAPPSQAG